MNLYIAITGRTFTIWIMAAIINGLLCGIYLSIAGYENGSVISLIFFSGICSLFFSIPGFFIFWIIMLVMINKQLYGRPLFRAALSTGMLLASVTAFFSAKMFSYFEGLAISLFVILSTITSIMMHFSLFKKITSKNEQYKN